MMVVEVANSIILIQHFFGTSSIKTEEIPKKWRGKNEAVVNVSQPAAWRTAVWPAWLERRDGWPCGGRRAVLW